MHMNINREQKKFKFFTYTFFLLMVSVASVFLGIIGISKIHSQNQDTNSNQQDSLVVSEDKEASIGLVQAPVEVSQEVSKTNDNSQGLLKGLGLIGAGIAFGLATLGAGIGIGNASSAAIGALSEKPTMFGISLVFVALCEGLVIFGFVLAAMIMGRI